MSSAAPAPSERSVEPEPDAVVVEAEPGVTPEPRSSETTTAGAQTEPSTQPPTGIPECDAYLALYKRCEEYLKPEIMAGVRRFHHAEQASLVYYAGTPEAATMPESCRSMMDALQKDCPEQHRSP